ncbi:hypothetical protein GH811_12610 [Acetobacterium malicum]|uniref:Uncharacterized protein n=1 Tax=Acetobacterium malicum TaxID=52692 RepID=A0ABR6YYY7_9FIRM|nr:UPF0489 family protein [Acetobacterium malicum]MBC3900458.1 hypothetical protein [Acetobacterium malicum]
MSNSNLNPRCLSIGGKEIRVVDDHQYVLLIWGRLFQNRKQPMVLVSIDYHPDTNPPFWLWAYQKAIAIDPDREVELVETFQRRMLAALEPFDLDSVQRVMGQMRNDEHINTALELGYLSDYHMINCMEKHVYSRGGHYLVPENKFGSLEDSMFKSIELPLEKISTADLILDIDLDYFMHPQNLALDLNQNSMFADLVKQAQIITVARSRTYFDFLKTDQFTIESCEDKLIDLLEKIIHR